MIHHHDEHWSLERFSDADVWVKLLFAEYLTYGRRKWKVQLLNSTRPHSTPDLTRGSTWFVQIFLSRKMFVKTTQCIFYVLTVIRVTETTTKDPDVYSAFCYVLVFCITYFELLYFTVLHLLLCAMNWMNGNFLFCSLTAR